ncbi:hypothetical protein [Janthinobacterium sp.]|uniref:hypothetical protein n=1 Tax=Janthinobacterium sp. TaxID=1871054 RepID=UPI002897D1EB|nr:hypothetical protein [Janthinobacterium sp.]
MPHAGYDMARQALTALEFFEAAYDQSPEFQERKAEIVAILKKQAQGSSDRSSKVARTLAMAIEAMR